MLTLKDHWNQSIMWSKTESFEYIQQAKKKKVGNYHKVI